MPSNHPNVDQLIASKTPLPLGHPAIDPYLCFVTYSIASAATSDIRTCPYIPQGHPQVDFALSSGAKLPAHHPLVDPVLRPYLPAGHPNCDELIAAGTPLPFGHPAIQPYLCTESVFTSGFLMVIFVSVSFVVVVAVRLMYAKFKNTSIWRDRSRLPRASAQRIGSNGTAEVEMMDSDQQLVPELLSPISQLQVRQTPLSAVSALSGESTVHVDNHKGIASDITPSHALDVEVPLNYSDLQPDNYTGVNPLFTKKPRKPPKSNSKEASEVPTAYAIGSTAASVGIHSEEDLEGTKSVPSDIMQSMRVSMRLAQRPPSLPRRNIALRDMEERHASHRNALYDYGEYADMPLPQGDGAVELPVDVAMQLPVIAQKRLSKNLGMDIEKLKSDAIESATQGTNHRSRPISKASGVPLPAISVKSNTFTSRIKNILSHYRLPYIDWSLGNMLTFVLYLAMNLICLFAAPGQNYGRSWGSLAAFNTMLLIVPATRNSILTLGLGLPFDHVVIYHRFFGRFTIMCVLIHFVYFIFAYAEESYVYLTGLGAMLFGLIIMVTSMDYVRRKLFNVFYWSHYSFVGYLTLAYFHCPQTQTYILVGAAIYVTDKILRMVWMMWPRTMTTFTNKGDAIAHVRFHKNPLTKLLDMHRVGQYYFVNFPALSLHEWHPFSVSSGPRENEIELHIRALGDHTKEVVKFATERGASKLPTWICIDGPYGVQNFNYRRYPVLLLCGGGIGITPVMCMVKDIYDIGLPADNHRMLAHAIDTVYLMWVMPSIADYECFRADLNTCVERAQEPGRPKLVLMVYITRCKEKNLTFPFIAGRPKVDALFETMNAAHKPSDACLVFACGPAPMVAELWDHSIRCTIDGRRMDFHHEVFEF